MKKNNDINFEEIWKQLSMEYKVKVKKDFIKEVFPRFKEVYMKCAYQLNVVNNDQQLLEDHLLIKYLVIEFYELNIIDGKIDYQKKWSNEKELLNFFSVLADKIVVVEHCYKVAARELHHFAPEFSTIKAISYAFKEFLESIKDAESDGIMRSEVISMILPIFIEQIESINCLMENGLYRVGYINWRLIFELECIVKLLIESSEATSINFLVHFNHAISQEEVLEESKDLTAERIKKMKQNPGMTNEEFRLYGWLIENENMGKRKLNFKSIADWAEQSQRYMSYETVTNIKEFSPAYIMSLGEGYKHECYIQTYMSLINMLHSLKSYYQKDYASLKWVPELYNKFFSKYDNQLKQTLDILSNKFSQYTVQVTSSSEE